MGWFASLVKAATATDAPVNRGDSERREPGATYTQPETCVPSEAFDLRNPKIPTLGPNSLVPPLPEPASQALAHRYTCVPRGLRFQALQ